MDGLAGNAVATGSVIAGKYRIEKLLATRGMGVVAAAYDIHLRRRVAIKCLAPDALQYPDVVERFIREGRSAATIRGEHVARVIDVGALEDGAPFMVLEYLEGVDLQKYLATRGRLPVVEVVRYVLEACEALAEAHAAKIVHRDLKPANLFLTEGPDRRKTIKVLDFGVSKLLDEPMTATAQMLGTVMYMSPEQLETANRVDARTDIWSLGVIMYELLAGAPPFSGNTLFKVAESIRANAPTPLSTIRADVSPELESVIMSCLRMNPAERPGSVLELAQALAPFARKRDRHSVGAIASIVTGELPLLGDAAGDSSSTNASGPPYAACDAPSLGPMIATAGCASDTIPSDVHPCIDASLLPPPPKPAPSARLPRSTDAHTRNWARRWSAVFLAAAVATFVIVIAGRHGASPVASAATAAAATSEVGDEIVLVITSTNEGAHVRIDDGPLVALPLETRAPRDAREHTLVVEAPGCTPRTKKVPFSSERILVDVHLGEIATD